MVCIRCIIVYSEKISVICWNVNILFVDIYFLITYTYMHSHIVAHTLAYLYTLICIFKYVISIYIYSYIYYPHTYMHIFKSINFIG